MAEAIEGKESRRDQILRTATQIFYEKTYHGATLQDIADAVGMLKGSLYYYIDSKEKLLADIILDAAYTLIENLERVEQTNHTPVERLRQIIKEYVRFNAKFRESGTLFLTERSAISSLDMAEVTEIFNRRNKLVSRALHDAIEAGIYRPVDLSLTSRTIVGLCNSMLFWYQPNRRLPPDEIADNFFDIVNQGLSTKS